MISPGGCDIKTPILPRISLKPQASATAPAWKVKNEHACVSSGCRFTSYMYSREKLEHTVVRRVIAFIDGILKNGVIPSVLEVSVPGVSSKITNLYI